MKRFMILIIAIFIFTNQSFPAMYANGIECLFVPNDCGVKATSVNEADTTSSLRIYLLKGATYFLESVSQYNQFLKFYETGNKTEMISYFLKANENMQLAKSLFNQIVLLSNYYSYNDDAIKQLKSFDYSTFQNENCLIGEIFEKVRSVLECGNIKGALTEIRDGIGEIVLEMDKVKILYVFPEKRTLWRLTQKIYETQLYGQYLSEVLSNLI